MISMNYSKIGNKTIGLNYSKYLKPRPCISINKNILFNFNLKKVYLIIKIAQYLVLNESY